MCEIIGVVLLAERCRLRMSEGKTTLVASEYIESIFDQKQCCLTVANITNWQFQQNPPARPCWKTYLKIESARPVLTFISTISVAPAF